MVFQKLIRISIAGALIVGAFMLLLWSLRRCGPKSEADSQTIQNLAAWIDVTSDLLLAEAITPEECVELSNIAKLDREKNLLNLDSWGSAIQVEVSEPTVGQWNIRFVSYGANRIREEEGGDDIIAEVNFIRPNSAKKTISYMSSCGSRRSIRRVSSEE